MDDTSVSDVSDVSGVYDASRDAPQDAQVKREIWRGSTGNECGNTENGDDIEFVTGWAGLRMLTPSLGRWRSSTRYVQERVMILTIDFQNLKCLACVYFVTAHIWFIYLVSFLPFLL